VSAKDSQQIGQSLFRHNVTLDPWVQIQSQRQCFFVHFKKTILNFQGFYFYRYSEGSSGLVLELRSLLPYYPVDQDYSMLNSQRF